MLIESESINSSVVFLLFVTPWTVAHQSLLSIGFSRQEYWSGHSFLQEIFLTQGSNLGLLNCRQILYHLSHQGRQNPHWLNK